MTPDQTNRSIVAYAVKVVRCVGTIINWCGINELNKINLDLNM